MAKRRRAPPSRRNRLRVLQPTDLTRTTVVVWTLPDRVWRGVVSWRGGERCFQALRKQSLDTLSIALFFAPGLLDFGQGWRSCEALRFLAGGNRALDSSGFRFRLSSLGLRGALCGNVREAGDEQAPKAPGRQHRTLCKPVRPDRTSGLRFCSGHTVRKPTGRARP